MRVYIYTITCIPNRKVYVGKTINPKQRFATHRWAMRRSERHPDCNQHLWNACQKHGIASFEFKVIEELECSEDGAREAELKWMDHFNSCDRCNGFNMRRDSATNMSVHPETAARMSEAMRGDKNPNHGNTWSQGQKDRMSEIAKQRHESGEFYGKEWRDKISKASSEMWKDDKKRTAMADKVSVSKRKYRFAQKTREGELLRVWDSVKDILSENPTWKWQNIYSVCNGYKKTYRGFIWEKVLINDT